MAGVIKFTLTLLFYVFSLVGKLKKRKKLLHNLRSCKNVANTNWPENETSSGSLFTASGPLQYFKTVKNKSYSILFPQTNVFKQIIDSFNGE